MRKKWYKKKFTFLLIREVNQSVIRFKLSKVMLVFVPILLMTVILTISATLFIIHTLHKDSLMLNQQLQGIITEKENEFSQIVAQKDSTIESLQLDVITLSHQAEEVRSKVMELQRLEREIKGITEPIASLSEQAPSKANLVSIASFSLDNQSAVQDEFETNDAVGGDYIAVTESSIFELADSTETTFHRLGTQMDMLYNELSEAKEQILAYQEYLRVTPSIWPTTSKRVTSNFGYRRDPFTRKLSFHSGIDIGGKRNDPVYATADGTVVTSGYASGAGHHVIIDHGNGIRTSYMHLNKKLVSKGDQVTKGEEIGLLGNTGRSTGPHLHYEIHINGEQVDPRPYM